MINEPLLEEIAETTGGQYFRATSAEALQQVYNEIDKLEKTEREVTTYKRYSDEFPIFIRVGLGFFLIHLLLQLTIFRTYP
jgi:Ca-activated chloride channel family protein